MGRNDANMMQDPNVPDVFEMFVKIEEEIRVLLRMRADQNRKMLVKMGRPGGEKIQAARP